MPSTEPHGKVCRKHGEVQHVEWVRDQGVSHSITTVVYKPPKTLSLVHGWDRVKNVSFYS